MTDTHLLSVSIELFIRVGIQFYFQTIVSGKMRKNPFSSDGRAFNFLNLKYSCWNLQPGSHRNIKVPKKGSAFVPCSITISCVTTQCDIKYHSTHSHNAYIYKWCSVHRVYTVQYILKRENAVTISFIVNLMKRKWILFFIIYFPIPLC